MDKSFYSASIGAGAFSARMDVIGNNIANMNTSGFKAKKGTFQDLIYTNILDAAGTDTNLKSGSGVKFEKASTDFSMGNFERTDNELDYAILGPGFFGLMNPETEEITYTRDGSFSLSLQQDDSFYLVAANGKWVLGPDEQPIVVTNRRDVHKIGVFSFDQKNAMMNVGDNEYAPSQWSGEPELITDEKVLQKGVLEGSNMDTAEEFTKIIETQRAYQYVLKMVQTSDEIENVYNSLRG